VLPRLDTVSIDWVVVTFASLAGVLSALLFGITPALRASRPAVNELLRAGGRSVVPSGTHWLRSVVVVGEVALSLVLLIGAGLMVRTFAALINTDPGYKSNNSLTFMLTNAGLRSAAERETFMRQMRGALRAIPGVVDVTAAGPLPLDGNANGGRWGTMAALANPSEFQQATYFTVLPGYFEAVGATLLEGRTFADTDNTPDARTVIIDDVLATKAFGAQSPIGQRLLVRPNANDPVPYEVIGVVRHQRHASLAGERREALYLTDGQMGHANAYRWIVRTTGDPTVIAPSVPDAARRVNSRVIVSELQPWTAFVDRATAPTRFSLFLISVFAGIALVLAAVGLYGVLSTTVRQRTSEIGVRIAFGANTGSILRLVLSLGIRLTVIGVAIGLVIAAGTTRVMQFMLVGVTPTDPITFATIAFGFLMIASCACALPARRAARMNPVSALRESQ
jgi:putative ABC transport system permease protein